MILRAVIVGRGPWGNMYEFSVAFAFGILGGYLFLQRRYPIRSLGFLPLGVALFLVGYAATLPHAIEPLVPALDNAPLLTIHVAMAMISYGIFAIAFGAAVGLPGPGPERPLRLAAIAQDARRGRLPGGHHRLPHLRHDDHPRLAGGPRSPGAATGAGTPRRPRRS